MDRVAVPNYCFGLMGLFLLQGVLSVEGRAIFYPGEYARKIINSANMKSKYDLEFKRKMTANTAEEKSITGKRGERK
uniref:Uncharacterized protein n=1 Tax=Gouania willdenowi TaxID=441366 RepID=A0A8C5I7P6_GOUWI